MDPQPTGSPGRAGGAAAPSEPAAAGAGQSAPAVVAVVVTHDPGPWFEEVLEGLAAQEYPDLSVLFIDAASTENPSARIARVLPNAFVRAIERNAGFGPAVNEVLDVVEGAAFYMICHDDVALAPDATRLMVEEAYRSNAGVVGPKLVGWDDPTVLLQVGLSADKTGVAVSTIEPGELDQEQHDAVRDVFTVPGGCTLVRSDLFAALGGFDPDIELLGEDLDLCWRAHVAGARVLVVPAAVARHRESLRERRAGLRRRYLLARHRVRTMLSCYSGFSLVRVVPQAAFLTVVEGVYALVAGRTAQAREAFGAWTWNLGRLGEIRAKRKRLKSVRQVRDSEVRRLQRRGSATVAAFLRGQIGRGDDRFASVATASRDMADAFRSGPRRLALGAWALVVAILLIGSRVLILGKLPAIGEMGVFPDSPFTLLRAWTSGWRSAGLGSESPAPTAFGLIGGFGAVLLGAMGLARKLLIVGLLPVGAIGAWRMLGPRASLRARSVCLVVFIAIPVPYNAIASGRWGGLAAWAAMPWVLRRLGRASGLDPFTPQAVAERRSGGRRVQHVLVLGLLTAVVSALVPFFVVVVLLVGVGLFAGSLLAGRRAGATAMLLTAVGAAVVASVLHVPWTLDFVLPGREWASFGGVGSAARGMTSAELLRFETGPLGAAPLGWAFLVVAALPLVIGRDWRLQWAIRAWAVALCCWGLAWAGQQSWLHVGLGGPEVLLAPVAASLAMAAALGVLAFETDLSGYRFGWRQAAVLAAAAAAVAGLLPVIGASVNGRWQLPRGDLNASLSFLDEENAGGQFRVLWIGDPDLVPLAGWELADGLAYATTDTGTPTVENHWSGSSDGPTRLVADALDIATRRETSRLGRLLAPMAVRYIVLPEAIAPVPFTDDIHPAPPNVLAALGAQLDLEQVEVNPSLVVYRNAAWAPMRSELPDPSIAQSTDPFFAVANGTDLSASTAVLDGHDHHASYSGRLSAGAEVFLSAAASEHWQLRADGASAASGPAFGWANSFTADGAGDATLRFRTPPGRYLVLGLEVLLWLAVVRFAWRHRTRRRSAGADNGDDSYDGDGGSSR